MKAVLWVDTVQSLVMVAGLLSVMIGGIWKVGGVREVWRIADEGGRINVWKYVLLGITTNRLVVSVTIS